MLKKPIFMLLLLFVFVYAAYAKPEYSSIISIDIEKASQERSSNISVDTEAMTVSGKLKILNDTSDDIALYIHGFYDLVLDGEIVKTRAEIINIPPSGNKIYTLEYKKYLDENDIISASSVSITNISPVPLTQDFIQKSWQITLPKSFEAISEADNVTKTVSKESATFTFFMEKPLESINIIASKDYISKSLYTKNTKIHIYFFKDSAYLADSYLKKTAAYIELYEKMLDSPFPYKRFSVVEDMSPYGYSSPTYTVIGSSVLKLPFILETSLGHEVLHQWFGCAITLAEHGNYFEALTTYLADHYYLNTKEQNNYRKNIITNYETYVKQGKEFPLSNFRYNADKLSQSIGYGKGAMVFHMVMTKIGKDQFYSRLAEFVKKNLSKRASWSDLLSSLGVNDKEFTDYWINGTKIPEIKVKNPNMTVKSGDVILEFDMELINAPQKLSIPYTVFYKDKTFEGFLYAVAGAQKFFVPLESPDAKFVIDNDYDLMRKLTHSESPATIAKIISADNITAIVSATNKCDDLLTSIGGIRSVLDDSSITLGDIRNKNIIICGYDNNASQLILGKQKKSDLSEYNVFKNPLSDDKLIMIANNPLKENVRLLKHYGTYSFLSFDKAKNITKESDNSSIGLVVYDKSPDSAVKTSDVLSVSDITTEASKYKAIFIGERHDNYAHHLNQLQIIKDMYKSGKIIAVGFEQVQKQFQKELDEFIDGKISERGFLKKIEYYERWGFDYNLYAPIFRFLRDNKIKAIALNIDGDINKKISSGNYDNLTKDELSALPRELNIVNDSYYNEIRQIFDMHSMGGEFAKNFGDFYAAQNVWDETMAESVADYQKANPNTTVIVIAGYGHLSKDSGIPLRYERLTGNEPYVIMQDAEFSPKSADIMLETESINSLGTPKIGITILETKSGISIESVDKDSPADKAGIKPKDILTECNNEQIAKIGDLRYEMFIIGYGNNLKCKLKRGDKSINVDISLTEWSPQMKSPHAGMMMPPSAK